MPYTFPSLKNWDTFVKQTQACAAAFAYLCAPHPKKLSPEQRTQEWMPKGLPFLSLATLFFTKGHRALVPEELST